LEIKQASLRTWYPSARHACTLYVDVVAMNG